MIYFDVTKTGTAKHRSGMMRVSGRLRDELGAAVREVVWQEGRWRLVDAPGQVAFKAADWLLTAELFCEAERPGFWDFLREKPCRMTAIFHDAIPISHPHITWPQSVSRHPEYMKMLAAFDHVFAVSQASRDLLTGFWDWQGGLRCAEVGTISLGADFLKCARPEPGGPPVGKRPSLMTVGILEPRKNQAFLLEVCEALWSEGVDFELNVVGRVNPHFGKPVAKRIAELRKRGRHVKHHEGADDEGLLTLYREARATVFPTIAEGCGLPLMESLWLGVPCVCSDLPVLRENADGGGCAAVALNDLEAWKATLRRVLCDDPWLAELRAATAGRVLPTWAQTAETLRAALA